MNTKLNTVNFVKSFDDKVEEVEVESQYISSVVDGTRNGDFFFFFVFLGPHTHGI